MKLNFASILLFSENSKELGDFYKKVFDKDPEWSDGGYYGFLVGNGFFTVGPHDKVHGKNSDPNRILLNFETEEVEEEFKRIKDLGATVVAEPYHPMEDESVMIATLADPDGNYFQVMTPWKGE